MTFNELIGVQPLSVVSHPRKLWVVLITISLIIGIALYADIFHVHVIRNDNGGTIVWTTDEAYLFMTVHHRGYQLTWPGYAAAAAREWFNAPITPTDEKVALTVIHVTPSAIERHIENLPEGAIPPHFFTPIGGAIYAFSEGTVYRWNGQNFDPAPQEEQKRLGGWDILSSDSDTSVNGWSKRGIGSVSLNYQFSVAIGKELVLRIIQGNVFKPLSDSPTVLLEKPGQPPATLWHVDGAPRIVSEFTYQRVFSAADSTPVVSLSHVDH